MKEIPDANRTAKGGADDVERRARASFGDHALAFAARGPDVTAKIVLACEREPSNAVVAPRLGVGPHTIGKWRKRFIADQIEGLYDEMSTGRPRTVEDEAVAELITKTLARKPKAATSSTTRPT